MKNIDVYYNTLLDILEYFRIIIQETEQEAKIEGEKIDFLIEKEISIRKEKRAINNLKLNMSRYENASNLILLIKEITDLLNMGYLYYNFNIFIYIIEKINEVLQDSSSEDIEDEYEEEKLKLMVVSNEEYRISSLYFSPKEEHRIVTLSFVGQDIKFEEFKHTINQITSLEVLISILDKLDFKHKLEGLSCILTDISYQNKDSICSYINMIQIYMGKTIHETKKSIYKINLKNNNNFDSIEQYIQFSDVFYILSEFNEENNILNKYLKVYQVIENFMFRIPLCELIDETGKMFTIRDFNRLYGKIDSKEKEALKAFFRKALLESDSNSVLLISLVKDYIDIFKSRHLSDLDNIKSNLIKKGFLSSENLDNIKNLNQIDTNKNAQNNLIGVTSNLVYKLRNSIVHNKATEFHLTNNNLDDYTKCLIDELIIPVLIEIIFFLVINKSKVITYESRELSLY